MGKNKQHSPGGGAGSESGKTPPPKGRGHFWEAAVVLAFASGFGLAVQATKSLCALDRSIITSDLAPTTLQGLWLQAALCGRPASPPSPQPVHPASIADVGAGGVGAAPGHDPWVHTTHPRMGTDGWNWTQLSMSRTGNFPGGDIKRFGADVLREKGAMWLWHTTYARSIPALITGLGKEYSDVMQHWKFKDYRERWGANTVVVAISDDTRFNRGVPDPVYGRLIQHPDRVRHTFHEYLDMVEAAVPGEHVAVQQSPSRDLSEFGLPALPPLMEDIVKHTLGARNFWAATPPKVSVLHYDWQDSVLLQISGHKRLTIIDPARMETAYPCVAYLQQLKRVGPGVFEKQLTDRELDNFPLVNATHPDLRRHPLFKSAKPFTVDLHPGDAFVMPAYWYHQIESFAPPGGLNVAVNWWFQGHSLATRLYRTLRENLFINCTERATPGVPHTCR
jgi:hypothetical protein